MEYIQSVRESLGLAGAASQFQGAGSGANNNDDNDDEEVWSSHLDALGDKLNQEGDKSGFLRMVNRSSRLNASSYSLSSLFSQGSVGCGSTVSGITASSRHSTRYDNGGKLFDPTFLSQIPCLCSQRSRRSHWQGPTGMKKLYKLLIEPLEDDMPEGFPCELVLVLEGDLYLVPFAMLKGVTSPETLCEKYSLLVSPSLTSIKNAKNRSNKGNSEDISNALVIGNPKIPSAISEQWGWPDIPYSAQEAEVIAEVMQTTALTGEAASKAAVLDVISNAECIHFACHVSWKLSALVLSPGEFMDAKGSPGVSVSKRYSINSDTIHEEEDSKSEVASSTLDLPSLSEFLLTAADILNLKLNAKLVVISSCYTRDITSDGVISLTKAFLAAGAQCVMFSMWPVPITSVKVVMKALYSSLLQGARVSRALADAMITAQSTKQLTHPSNWAGMVLVGSDIKMSNKVALMGQALRDILSTPESCREALRVTLHLVGWPSVMTSNMSFGL